MIGEMPRTPSTPPPAKMKATRLGPMCKTVVASPMPMMAMSVAMYESERRRIFMC